MIRSDRLLDAPIKSHCTVNPFIQIVIGSLLFLRLQLHGYVDKAIGCPAPDFASNDKPE